MEMERIVGLLFSGFMCKVYAGATAIWMAVEAGSFVFRAFGLVNKGFGE